MDPVAGYALFAAGPAAGVLVAEGFAVFSVLTGYRKKGATFRTLYRFGPPNVQSTNHWPSVTTEIAAAIPQAHPSKCPAPNQMAAPRA